MAEIIQMDEHSWRIEDTVVRFFVLEGTEKALLIGSGMNTPDARENLRRKIPEKAPGAAEHACGPGSCFRQRRRV